MNDCSDLMKIKDNIRDYLSKIIFYLRCDIMMMKHRALQELCSEIILACGVLYHPNLIRVFGFVLNFMPGG